MDQGKEIEASKIKFPRKNMGNPGNKVVEEMNETSSSKRPKNEKKMKCVNFTADKTRGVFLSLNCFEKRFYKQQSLFPFLIF